MKMVVRVALSLGVVLLSACSSMEDSPGAWEVRSDTIHVYVSGSRKPVEIASSGQVVTLIDAVFEARQSVGDQSVGDLRHVLVLRRAGAETIRLEVDVRDMLRTGNTANNIQLQSGDVVRIAG